MKTQLFIFILILFTLCGFDSGSGYAQQPEYFQLPDRFQVLQQQLEQLAKDVPGLNAKVDFGVSGASIQEFLRGVAETNDLNISIDPNLNHKIYNNFTGEKVSSIFLFLAKEYDLDIRFTGSIMSFSQRVLPPPLIPVIPRKEIKITFNSYTNLISFDLQEDTLSSVVKRITRETKTNIIIAPTLLPKRVSVYVESLPLDNALEKLAFANNLLISKTTDNSYLLEDAAVELTASQANSNNKQANRSTTTSRRTGRGNTNDDPYGIQVKDSLSAKFISFNAANVPIIDLLKEVSDQLGLSYFLFSEIKGNTTSIVKNIKYDDFLGFLFQGTDYTFKKENNIYLIGERKLEGLRAAKVIQFQYRSLETMMEIIPAEIKKGVEIKEFKELNSILLSGSMPQILEVEAFVKELDKVVPMVLIEVILMDVRRGNSIKTGIKAGLSDSVKTGGNFLPGFDFTFGSKSINDFLSTLGPNNTVNLGKVSPKFYIGLSALEQNNAVEVRSVPKLSTLNGHDANLSIGSTRYYSTTTQNVLGSLNPQTVVTQQFTPVQANLTINIKPFVSGDDQVTLNIDVSISDFIGDPPANSPPPSSTSQFKSIIRVKNEDMIVLGGLERVEKSESGSGTPYLSRIPVIKWFFSSRNKSKSKIISVVFIKPTIIY